ncbi:MAG: TIGR04211 family SH3 domain-containing protein [Thiohalomonadales bacterium]
MPGIKPRIQTLKLLCNLILLSISVFSYAETLYAETVYVSDNLRVGVRPSPDSSIAPINVVTSGMHLTVIERESGYIKIRTNTGITGWVKEVYMTKEIPVREKFKALNVKFEKQSTTISELEKSIENLTKVKLTLIADLDKERTEKSDVELKLARLLEQKYVDNLGNSQSSLVVISIVVFVIAFIIGMLWYRFLVTKRLGGLRL